MQLFMPTFRLGTEPFGIDFAYRLKRSTRPSVLPSAATAKRTAKSVHPHTSDEKMSTNEVSRATDDYITTALHTTHNHIQIHATPTTTVTPIATPRIYTHRHTCNYTHNHTRPPQTPTPTTTRTYMHT